MRVGRFDINPIDAVLAILLPITAFGLYAEFLAAPTPQEVIEALANGNDELARAHLDEDFDYGARDETGFTVLHAAAVRTNPMFVLRALMHGGVECANAYDNSGLTPMHWAILYERHRTDPATLRAFLSSGVSPNLTSRDGVSLLEYALIQKSRSAVLQLIESGADPNFGSIYNENLAVYLIKHPELKLLGPMLDAGLSPNIANDTETNPPLAYAIDAQDDSVLPLLLRHGADPNARVHARWVWTPPQPARFESVRDRYGRSGRGGRLGSGRGGRPVKRMRAPAAPGRWTLLLSAPAPTNTGHESAPFGFAAAQPHKKPVYAQMLPLDYALFKNRKRAKELIRASARAELFPILLTHALKHH